MENYQEEILREILAKLTYRILAKDKPKTLMSRVGDKQFDQISRVGGLSLN